MPSSPITEYERHILAAAEQIDAQATLHSISLTGDWTELAMLRRRQLRWLLSFVDSPAFLEHVSPYMEKRNA